jgi:uncharacterized coiled-coil protein SlyX
MPKIPNIPKIPPSAVIAVAILVVGFLIGVWAGPDIDPLKERIAALESRLDEQGGASAAASAAAGEAKAAAEDAKGALDALSARVDEVAAQAGDASAIKDRFNAFETSLNDQMTALKTNVSDVTQSLSAFKDETAAMIKTAAEGTQMAAAPSSGGAAAAGPVVQRLAIGASGWAVEGLVSVALSAIQGEDSARVYVNGAPLVLELNRAVRLRDLPDEAGDCTATLKGIHGRQADIAVDCQG